MPPDDPSIRVGPSSTSTSSCQPPQAAAVVGFPLASCPLPPGAFPTLPQAGAFPLPSLAVLLAGAANTAALCTLGSGAASLAGAGGWPAAVPPFTDGRTPRTSRDWSAAGSGSWPWAAGGGSAGLPGPALGLACDDLWRGPAGVAALRALQRCGPWGGHYH